MKQAPFRQQLLSLQDGLFRFAFSLTSNREEAQDLLQDTTLRALDNESKFEENSNMKAWAFTIMRNVFINNYRKVVKNHRIIDATEELYHLNLPQDSGILTPEGAYGVQEILRAINNFEDDLRLPFSMHVSGYKYHEISEKLNLPMGTVKSRIFFARQSLQQQLKDYR